MDPIEHLYTCYKQDVYGYLYSLTHNPSLSEELLSETFLKTITSLKNYKGQSSAKTWLFGIARNLWLQRIRKERKTVEYNDLLGLYVSDTIIEALITEESVSRIRELLLDKDARTQTVVNMRVEGYSYSEIGLETGLSENSARVIDFRTKRSIKTVLEKEGFV